MMTKTILSAAVVATTISAGATETVTVNEINSEFEKATIQLCCGYQNNPKLTKKRARKVKRNSKANARVAKRAEKSKKKENIKVAKL